MSDAAAHLPSPVLHSVSASDGWLLRVWDFGGGLDVAARPKAVVVLGHAMLADSRTLCRPDRPTLASVLVDAGFRVLVPDLRGHGESGPSAAAGGDWSLDELVADVGSYVDLAVAVAPEAPVVLVGHSLFGQAALAWLGQNPDPRVRSVATLGTGVWNRRFEPSLAIWWLKLAIYLVTMLIVALVGYMPGRALRLGSADEAASYWRQAWAWMRRNRWCSLDGSVDYWAGLEGIRVPFLHVLSEGDRLYARPPAASLTTAGVVSRELLVTGRSDAPGELAELRPGHMGLVTDLGSKMLWHWVAGWLERSIQD
ncbi:alpha/beta fold hydrolase [Pseudenhygromyxa sp. WMMC2535]|uniref:alpha/beta fold hydrolase n=1 Tax=Pseudenhygromyxa sp. WMMC2535 TaxID=2712867 RepID=UPI00155689EF|nr:alpha/beta fold hydrolase [Pseudenhygromyxa sp. WMMC2535]NVB38603.1 alpha/beta fold hydrolase [Pseudenhygromyxa sp. WMMC2535]